MRPSCTVKSQISQVQRGQYLHVRVLKYLIIMHIVLIVLHHLRTEWILSQAYVGPFLLQYIELLAKTNRYVCNKPILANYLRSKYKAPLFFLVKIVIFTSCVMTVS